MDSRGNLKLPKVLINFLKIEGISNIAQATSREKSTIWTQEWKTKNKIGLEGHGKEKWEAYIDIKLKILLF